MRILHFSDTHLGFTDLDIVNDKGFNQREDDFYDAFKQVVEQIKLKKPDFIIHTGDLFHRSSPSNRALTFALEQFHKIEKLNIPFIIIAGNHSTPKSTQNSPILKILEPFKNIHAFYAQCYGKVEFKDIVFHAIPHINDESKIENELQKCEENIEQNKKNILMLHCSVGAFYLMKEFGEWVYPKNREYLFEKMDYVALGHWHGFGSVNKHKNVFYSGSTERTSSNDTRNSKGYVMVDLIDGSIDGTIDESIDVPKVSFHEITVRKSINFEIDAQEFYEQLHAINIDALKDALINVKLTNLTPISSIEIQNSDILEYFKNSLHINIKREFKEIDNEIKLDDVEAISLESYFLEHIKADATNNEYERLEHKTKELFAKYEELNSDS